MVGNGFLFGIYTEQWHYTYLTAAHTFRVSGIERLEPGVLHNTSELAKRVKI